MWFGGSEMGKSERQQRLLRGVPAVAIRRKAMYIVRASVLRDQGIGAAGRPDSGFVSKLSPSKRISGFGKIRNFPASRGRGRRFIDE
jgi:hypothetical protein